MQHLGGHLNKVHVDTGVLKFLYDTLDIKSMTDVGCGPAWMVEEARKLGIDAIGIDGDRSLDIKDSSLVYFHDFRTPIINSKINFECDLIWSVEFVEHVEEKYMDNFLDVFAGGKYICMTHALPNDTGGHHHVNLQPSSYWINVIESRGFRFDSDNTSAIRAVSTMKKDFMRKTGLFFKKRGI